jgi:hypothetical protein
MVDRYHRPSESPVTGNAAFSKDPLARLSGIVNTMAENVIRCSFCDKSQRDVFKMVAGPKTFICNECIEIAVDICEEDGVRINLSRDITRDDLGAMAVRPKFKNIKISPRQNHCFYLSPFAEPFDSIYDGYVTPTFVNEGFSIVRADQLYGTEPIIEDIWTAINEASLIVADVTGRNPNVAYEIGIAHTVGKPVIMVTQNIADVPFDLRHLRCIVYANHAEGYKQLQNKLIATLRVLKAALNRNAG